MSDNRYYVNSLTGISNGIFRVSVAFCLLCLPRFADAQQAERVYIYSSHESGMRSKLAISLDGTILAKLKRGTFFAVNTTEGRRIISTSKGVPLFVDLKAGQQAFVRLGMRAEVGELSTVVFDSMPPRVASQEMRFVLYIEAKDVLSASVPKTDPRPAPDMPFKKREGASSE